MPTPFPITIDRSLQPGRLRLTFASGANGSLVREPIWGYDHTTGEPYRVGPGLNIGALGTLSAPELRCLAAVLLEEATSIEAAVPERSERLDLRMRDHWDHRAKDGDE